MSLKAEIEQWAAGLAAYDAQDFDRALELFDAISDTSRINFNMGLILATCGRHEEAVAAFRRATELDTFFAVAFFQCGVSNFLLQRYDEARADFGDAFQHLRGNLTIDYEQLGLKFRLYSCEVLFNRGLCSVYLGDEISGMADLDLARSEKQTEEHGVIDEAIAERGDGFTVYSCPVSILFRPSEGKLRNVKTKNYLGEARLIAATEARDAFVGFTGSTRKALEGGRPVSTGPNAPLLTATVNGLNRAKTAAAIEARPTGAAALRRRPTDNSASVTLARSGSAGSSPTNISPRAPPLQRSVTTIGTRQLASSADRGLGSGAVAGERGMVTPPGTAPQSAYDDSGSVLDDYAAYIDGTAVENEGENRFSRPKGRPTVHPSPAPLASRRLDPPAQILPQGQSRDRVAAWAQKTAAQPVVNPVKRSPSTAAASSSRYNTIVRRGTTNRRNVSSPTGRRRYDEDEEGYGSGEYDEGTSTVIYELARIRIKLHHEGDVRGMSITPDIAHTELVTRVQAKLGLPELMLRYRDDDGAMISIVDEDDWASAVDCARETAQGRPESKLEIFVA